MENQNSKENKRKTIVLLVIALIAIVAMIAGATYAYFQAQQGTGQSSDVNVTTGTTDNLNFNITDLDVTRTDIVDEDNEEVPITINASMTNFTDKDNSLGDGVSATATLIANDATNTAEENYYVYLYITKNELQYSSYKRNNPLDPDTDNKNTLVFKTPEEKSDAELGEYSPIPELYLTIKKNGEEITSGVTIKDTELTHVEGILVDPNNEENPTGKTLGGFDITEAKGLIKIEGQQTINVEEGTDNNTKTDTWEIIVTFMNLETDQNLNTGKKLEGQVLIQKEEKTLIQDKLLADANKDGITTLYLHDSSLKGGAEDDSYRYAGSDKEVKNYVCLDGGATSEGECANGDADLYRIIGLFKNNDEQYEIKLIKYDYATTTELGTEGTYKETYSASTTNYKGKEENIINIGGYDWITSSSIDEWPNSELRKTNLNDYYLYTYLKGKKHIDIDNLIEPHIWKLNGYDTYKVTPKLMYDNEINIATDSNPSKPTQTREVQDKIGLMYASDYGYAADPIITNNWNETIRSYDSFIANNWLYMGLTEWTISRMSNSTYMDYVVYSLGYVYSFTGSNTHCAVRPCFYLSSDVKIKSGDGSKGEPYRLVIE